MTESSPVVFFEEAAAIDSAAWERLQPSHAEVEKALALAWANLLPEPKKVEIAGGSVSLKTLRARVRWPVRLSFARTDSFAWMGWDWASDESSTNYDTVKR